MDNNILQEIVALCLNMDKQAIEIYNNFSLKDKNLELREFWGQMSEEESQHVIYWEKLLELVKKQIIPQIFKNPEKTLSQLEANNKKITKLISQSNSALSITDSFVLAFRLEFYLLHPALERFWHFYGIIQKGKYSPEKDYDNHVHQFILALRKFGVVTNELEALGETVERMWDQSRTMAEEANFDDLTGILNRRGYFNVITSLAYLAKRNKFNSAILMIDIDHFKKINDTLGHQAGDTVLKKVAGIIKTNIRTSDILGRFGGEEFLVFLPQIDIHSIYKNAAKIKDAVEEGTRQNIPVTVSIGGACMEIKGDVKEKINTLIKLADQNMYNAKKKGRNQVIC